jgi:hypothetical protein
MRVKKPSSEGTVPVKELTYRCNTANAVKEPSSDRGTVPVNELYASDIYINEVKEPSSDGTVPVKVLPK